MARHGHGGEGQAEYGGDQGLANGKGHAAILLDEGIAAFLFFLNGI
jgi:hypothetical protein